MLGLRRRGKPAGGDAGPSLQIDADLSGAVVSGQVAIGEHIVQIHAEHGAIVNYRPPAERPAPRAREVPIRRLPRGFDALVGRDQLLSEVHAVLAHGGPVELVGEPGIGKTALLRNVSHHLAELQPHGVVYTAAHTVPAADVLQFLFESFYDCGGEVVVATPAELSRYLGDRQALIVVDDAELPREELQQIMDVVRGSTFLCATPERRVWGEGQSFDVRGLDAVAARTLLERELGRRLAAQETKLVLDWCRALGGSPLRILQVGDLLRDGVLAAEATTAGSANLTPATLDRLLGGQMSEASRQVIAPLAAIRAAPVPTDTIAAATGVDDAGERLARLEAAHIVESHSPRYTLAGDPGPALVSAPGRDDASALAESARAALIGVFAGGSEDRARDSNRGIDDAQILLALLRDAERREAGGDILALAHAGDRVLAISGRWGAWKVVLEAALRAARARGAPAEEAWALHQLGSRALGVGDRAAAGHLLTGALELRQTLGDRAGAAVTRHNLDLLSGPPPPDHPPPRPRPRLPLVAGATILVAAAGAAIAVAAGSGGSAPATASHGTTTRTTRHITRTTATKPTTPTKPSTPTAPPPALQITPDPILVRVQETSGVVSGGGPVVVTNTGSATVTIEAVTPDTAQYTVSVRGCEHVTIASRQICTGFVYLRADAPHAPPAKLTFVLGGAAAVPAGITVCLIAPPLYGSAAVAAPSASAAPTGTTTTTTTTTTTNPPALIPPC